MEESLSPAQRDQHILLYSHDIVAEYSDYLEILIANLNESMRLNIDYLNGSMDEESEEMETYVELLNNLLEVCMSFHHYHHHQPTCPSNNPPNTPTEQLTHQSTHPDTHQPTKQPAH